MTPVDNFPIRIELIDFSNAQQAAEYVTLLNSYSQDPLGGNKALPEFTLKNLAGSLSKRDDVIGLIAYANKKPAGLLTSFEGFSTFSCKPLLNIHDVFVTPEFRGNNIAIQMLMFAERIARKRGYCKLTLEVLEMNTAAISVYSKAGFCGYELDPQFGKAIFLEKKL